MTPERREQFMRIAMAVLKKKYQNTQQRLSMAALMWARYYARKKQQQSDALIEMMRLTEKAGLYEKGTIEEHRGNPGGDQDGDETKRVQEQKEVHKEGETQERGIIDATEQGMQYCNECKKKTWHTPKLGLLPSNSRLCTECRTSNRIKKN